MHLIVNNNYLNNLAIRRCLMALAGILCLFTFLTILNLNGTDTKELPDFKSFEIEAGSELESFVHLSTFGRLGNQLFEYACSYSIARKLKIPLFLDVPTTARDDGTYGPADFKFNLHRLHVSIPSDETRKRFMQKVINSSHEVFRLNDINILTGEYPVSQLFKFCLITITTYVFN
jgi:hypothetical protein